MECPNVHIIATQVVALLLTQTSIYSQLTSITNEFKQLIGMNGEIESRETVLSTRFDDGDADDVYEKQTASQRDVFSIDNDKYRLEALVEVQVVSKRVPYSQLTLCAKWRYNVHNNRTYKEHRNLGIRKHVTTSCSGTKPFY